MRALGALFTIAVIVSGMRTADASDHRFGPSSAATVDKTMDIALAIDPSKIDLKPGPWRCRMAGSEFSGTGETMGQAQLSAGIRCIKTKCAHLGDDSANRILQDPEFDRVLKDAGIEPAVIRAIRDKYSDETFRTELNSNGCTKKDHTGILQRTMVYDFCFAVPYECTPVEPCSK